MEISEKEFAVIRQISDNNLPDQRAIALKTGISLGLTNLIIKRLIKKGYIKARQLNRRKIQYLLTPAGFAEKARKSYDFARRTIALVKSVKNAVKELIAAESMAGSRNFTLSGDSELVSIAGDALRELERSGRKIQFEIEKKSRRKRVGEEAAVLRCLNERTKQTRRIDLIRYVSDAGLF